MSALDVPCVEELTQESNSQEWNYIAILYCTLSVLLTELYNTMLVTFFTKDAKGRGLGLVRIGWIFAVVYLTNVLASLVVPFVTQRIGSIRALVLSNLFLSVTTSTFGLTGLIKSGVPFFWVCFLLRSFQGLFTAFSDVCSIGLMIRSVPRDKVGDCIGILEGFRFMGAITGPFVGALLYDALGYGGPFLISGALFLILFISMNIFPISKSVDAGRDQESDTSRRNITTTLLRSPVIQVICVLNVLLTTGLTFLEPTLQPFLSKPPYDLSSVAVAAVYISLCISFIISTVISPPLSKLLGDAWSIGVGTFLIGVGYFISFPSEKADHGMLSLSSFMHQSNRNEAIAMAVSGLIIAGAGGGMVVGPTNYMMLSEGEYMNIGVEVASDPISSILVFSWGIGCTLGPSLSGLFTHHLGFTNSCALLGYIILLSSILFLVAIKLIFRHREKRHNQEAETDLTDRLLVDNNNDN